MNAINHIATYALTSFLFKKKAVRRPRIKIIATRKNQQSRRCRIAWVWLLVEKRVPW